MKKQLAKIILSAATATVLVSAQAQYNYTILNVPGAQTTAANGISGNSVVGYDNTGSAYQGFLYNGSSYATFAVPGALDTEAYGINGNNIVGFYLNSGGVPEGFIYNGSTFTTLNVPGANNTTAYGISGNDIVGIYGDGSGTHGFVFNGSSYTTLNLPGAVDTYATAIDGNDIVGYSYDGNSYQGFLFNGSSYTTLTLLASGISGNNILAGGTREYNINDGIYTPLNLDVVPGEVGADAYGIDGNDIVGTYEDGSGVHSFLATPTPTPEPSTVILAALGTASLLAFRRRWLGDLSRIALSLTQTEELR